MRPSLLSIIIPVYNTAPWLRRCLDSICAQSYRNLEILCVNDGSTDNSAEILAEYAAKDERIKVFTQANAGVSAARNRGIDMASGEFITFVDGDDWLESNTYQMALAAMQDGVDLVCFGISIDGDISAEDQKRKEEYYAIKYSGNVDCGTKEILSTDASASNKVFRRELLDRYQLRFIEGKAYGEDAAFYVCYAAVACRTYFLPELCYHYVQHADSAMAASVVKNPRCIDHLAVVREVIAFFERVQLPPHRHSLPEIVFARFYAFGIEFTPPEMANQVNELAYDIGKKYNLLGFVRSYHVRKLRQLYMSRLERSVHWFAENRECYGLFGQAIWSITYEKGRNVHRLLGRVVRKVPVEELE